jgi:hypothetical protein
VPKTNKHKNQTISVYKSNTASKYIKQKLTELKGEADISTITVTDLDVQLSTAGRTTGQKTNKGIEHKSIN